MFKNQTNQNLLFPLTIIIIGVIVSAGIFVYRSGDKFNIQKTNTDTVKEVTIKPISDQDKILGNPNADVFIVEYSDFECPYCKIFHSTMNDLMSSYGRNGKVAWVYRHFPIEKHKNAKNAAISSECVYRIAGNEKFWDYSNLLFASSTELTKESLEKIAVSEIGIDPEQYLACLKNTDVLEKIESDIADGKLIYENDPDFGTPYSFVVTKTGIQTKIIGAQPLSKIKELVDKLI
jgi:protein-disulfide isomerase